MKPILLALSFCLFSFSILHAQGVKISSTPGNPDTSAILELESSSKGFLLPRMTTAERGQIVSPADGLQIYNTTTDCIEAYFNGVWLDIRCQCQAFPDASFSVSSNPSIGSPVTFTAIGGGSHSWVFPSGTPSTSTASAPNVTWSIAGTYNIIHTITDVNGCSASDTTQITVTNCPPGSQTFNFTGGMQTFTVPSCVTSINVTLYGAEGGTGAYISGTPGRGGYVNGDLTVTGGETLNIIVGGKGGNTSSTNGGGGGGGLSAILRGSNPIVVAGGGGGAASSGSQSSGGDGGDGGGIGGGGDGGDIFSNSNNVPGGDGGTGTGQGGFSVTTSYPDAGDGGSGYGGAGRGPSGPNNPTSTQNGTPYGAGGVSGAQGATGGYGGGGCGGNYSNNSWGSGGGGGGGYNGGGGGNSEGNNQRGGGGGGGGSSFITNLTNATQTLGQRTGNGQIIISW